MRHAGPERFWGYPRLLSAEGQHCPGVKIYGTSYIHASKDSVKREIPQTTRGYNARVAILPQDQPRRAQIFFGRGAVGVFSSKFFTLGAKAQSRHFRQACPARPCLAALSCLRAGYGRALARGSTSSAENADGAGAADAMPAPAVPLASPPIPPTGDGATVEYGIPPEAGAGAALLGFAGLAAGALGGADAGADAGAGAGAETEAGAAGVLPSGGMALPWLTGA